MSKWLRTQTHHEIRIAMAKIKIKNSHLLLKDEKHMNRVLDEISATTKDHPDIEINMHLSKAP